MALLETALAVVVDAALGIWLGSIVFFSFVGAPTTFSVLGDDAGQVVNAIFPTYYVFGLALGLIAIVAVALAPVLAPATASFDALRIALLGLLASGVGMNVVARWGLIPKMEQAGDDAFAQYHRQSVILNGLTMVVLAAALVVSHA